MDQIIKCLLLKNGDIIISQIVEVDPDGGVVPLCDTAPEPNPKTEVDEFAELDTTFNQ